MFKYLIESIHDTLHLFSDSSFDTPSNHLIHVLVLVAFCDFNFFAARNELPLCHLKESKGQQMSEDLRGRFAMIYNQKVKFASF